MKIYKKQFSAKDLLDVAMDSGMRVGSTPFGAPPGERTMYMGRSVPWKGAVGLEAVRAINPKVAAGLENARALSMAHTEKGSAWVQYPNGEIVAMPMKCYAMMEAAVRPVTLIGHRAAKRPWIISKPRARRVPVAPASA